MGYPKMIYTNGDSHAWHAWLHIPGVKTNTIGPMLMYSVGVGKANVGWGIPTDGVLVLCWGEIDCRCHIAKYPPYKECIDGIVSHYLEQVREHTKEFPHVWLFNVVPPPRRDHIPPNPHLGFPFVGTDAERLSFVKQMNRLLSESGFPFIDVYDSYADQDGFLKMEMSDGHVHIADIGPLKRKVDEMMEKIK